MNGISSFKIFRLNFVFFNFHHFLPFVCLEVLAEFKVKSIQVQMNAN